MIAPFDIFGAALVLFFALRVMFKGFVNEVLSLGAPVGGIIAAALLSGNVAKIVTLFVDSRIWSQAIAFLAVFIVVYALIKIIHRWVAHGMEAINLTNLDRALGFCLGVLEGLAIIVAIVLLIEIAPPLNAKRVLGDSVVARIVSPFVPTVLRIFE